MDRETSHKRSLRIIKLAILVLVSFCLAMVIFGFGVLVGQERADFSFEWAQNYHRNFGGPMKGFFGNFPGQDFISGHGIFGPIIKIDGDNLIVRAQGSVETTVVVSPQTLMRNNNAMVSLKEVKVGDTIIVIGSPDNQGRIQAKFIRVMPPQNMIFWRIHANKNGTPI